MRVSMVDTKAKRRHRVTRHQRLRRKVSGFPERPRLVVFRSLKHIYAQIIDDSAARTLVSAGTDSNDLKGKLEGTKTDAAKAVGTLIAERAVAAGIKKVTFDRGGFKFHGRVKALAEAAREAGLEF